MSRNHSLPRIHWVVDPNSLEWCCDKHARHENVDLVPRHIHRVDIHWVRVWFGIDWAFSFVSFISQFRVQSWDSG